jgi:hypothetical protein
MMLAVEFELALVQYGCQVPAKALSVIMSWPDGPLADVAQQAYKALQLSDTWMLY